MLRKHTLLLITYLSFSTIALLFPENLPAYSAVLTVFAGAILMLLVIMSHNFFHQRDTWRRFTFDLSFFSSHEWRMFHVFTHHTYPNTHLDFEVVALEPFALYLAYGSKKTDFVRRLLMPVYLQVLFLLAMYIQVQFDNSADTPC
jgi:hypothetical protein